MTSTYSVFIPRVFSNIRASRISDTFHNLDIGDVEKVDLVAKTGKNGDSYNMAFVHFKRLYDTEAASDFRKELEEPEIKTKVVYEDPWFWLVLPFEKKDKPVDETLNNPDVALQPQHQHQHQHQHQFHPQHQEQQQQQQQQYYTDQQQQFHPQHQEQHQQFHPQHQEQHQQQYYQQQQQQYYTDQQQHQMVQFQVMTPQGPMLQWGFPMMNMYSQEFETSSPVKRASKHRNKPRMRINIPQSVSIQPQGEVEEGEIVSEYDDHYDM